MPCYCDDMQENEATELHAATDHQAEDCNDDNCNPFFGCNCCPSTAFFFQRNFSIHKPVPINVKQVFTLLDQHFTSYNSQNIWQPPRV